MKVLKHQETGAFLVQSKLPEAFWTLGTNIKDAIAHMVGVKPFPYIEK